MNGNERRNDCLKDGCSDDECEYVNNMTVFEKITASPEVLAEKFVYHICDSDGYGWWTSTLCNYTKWKLKSEAIAAMVAKLKEVEG